MRYLAIDHGTKRTGLAICDAEERIASPLTILQGRKDLIDQIAQVIEAEGVGGIVVGLPLNMDDSQGPQAKEVMAFAERLRVRVSVPLYFQDERLTSFGADEKLNATGLSRSKRRGLRDAVAAAEILETFLQQSREP